MPIGHLGIRNQNGVLIQSKEGRTSSVNGTCLFFWRKGFPSLVYEDRWYLCQVVPLLLKV